MFLKTSVRSAQSEFTYWLISKDGVAVCCAVKSPTCCFCDAKRNEIESFFENRTHIIINNGEYCKIDKEDPPPVNSLLTVPGRLCRVIYLYYACVCGSIFPFFCHLSS